MTDTVAPPTTAALEVTDLEVAYMVRGIPRIVLRGVSFRVAPGEAYGLVGESVSDDAGAAMTAYLAGHQRGRLGRVVTSGEMFGLNEDELHARFAPYVSRFLS